MTNTMLITLNQFLLSINLALYALRLGELALGLL